MDGLYNTYMGFKVHCWDLGISYHCYNLHWFLHFPHIYQLGHKGLPHGAKSKELYRFSEEFWLLNFAILVTALD